MVVFLKTSEEATCEPKENCVFTWDSWVPNIEDASVMFDDSTLEWQFVTTGVDFQDNIDKIDL